MENDIKRMKACITAKANKADKRGKLKKPDRCEGCETITTKLERHHHDYNKPFDVTWLCSQCHGEKHRRLSPYYVAPIPPATYEFRTKRTAKTRTYKIPIKLKLLLKADRISFHKWCQNNGFKHSSVTHLFSGETIGIWGEAKRAKDILDKDYKGWDEFSTEPEIKLVLCKKCGHVWKPRILSPEFCPKCKNANWNISKRTH